MMAAIWLITVSTVANADNTLKTEPVRLLIPASASAEEAYREIRTAARRACSSRAIYPHQQLERTAACKEQFVSDAVAAFDRPQLTKLHGLQTEPGAERFVGNMPE